MRRWLFLVSLLTVVVSACGKGPPVAPEREVTVDGSSYRVITVSQLGSILDNNKDFLLVNVHIPYAGEIKGTDLFIPYNEIEQNLTKIPDKGAKIVLYCRSGNMSGIAAKTLTRLGYTNIRDVEGGMEAWQEAGYQLMQRPQAK